MRVRELWFFLVLVGACCAGWEMQLWLLPIAALLLLEGGFTLVELSHEHADDVAAELPAGRTFEATTGSTSEHGGDVILLPVTARDDERRNRAA